jgi:hypothetical protein
MPRYEGYLLSGSGRGLVDGGHTTGDRPTNVYMKNIHFVVFAVSLVTWILTGCQVHERKQEGLPNFTTEELITIVKNEQEPYLLAISELGKRPEDGSISAPVLTEALSRKRRDYYEAAVSIIKLGSSAKEAVPELVALLDNDNPGTRAYSAFSLGSIGEPAECAVPKLAALMWDKDGEVRTASASALDSILKMDLVDDLYQTDAKKPYGISVDIPEGSITKKARSWWLNGGNTLQWSEKCLTNN